MDQLEQAASAAVACEAHTGCPAALLVAQWALESGWGKHAPGFNCFGIKSRAGDERQLLRTREWFTAAQLKKFLSMGDGRTAEPTGQVNGLRREYNVQDWFAAFPSLAACFDRRAALFRAGRYKPFAEQFDKDGDVAALVKGIAPIYATSPEYESSIMRIINQANVQAALKRLVS